MSNNALGLSNHAVGLSDIFIWVAGQSILTSICSESASVCFFYKKKLLPSLFLKSNLLIYLAVHIQFVPVYIHTHFKDRYQHHQFLPILNTHHQTSSPIIRYYDSQCFSPSNTKGQPWWICIIGIWLFYHYLCCKIDLLVNNHFHTIMLPPPPITLSCIMHLHHQNAWRWWWHISFTNIYNDCLCCSFVCLLWTILLKS